MRRARLSYSCTSISSSPHVLCGDSHHGIKKHDTGTISRHMCSSVKYTRIDGILILLKSVGGVPEGRRGCRLPEVAEARCPRCGLCAGGAEHAAAHGVLGVTANKPAALAAGEGGLGPGQLRREVAVARRAGWQWRWRRRGPEVESATAAPGATCKDADVGAISLGAVVGIVVVRWLYVPSESESGSGSDWIRILRMMTMKMLTPR